MPSKKEETEASLVQSARAVGLLSASLQRSKTPSSSVLYMTLSSMMVKFQDTGVLQNVEYPFTAIVLRSTLSPNGST